jgi:hypothetical protein
MEQATARVTVRRTSPKDIGHRQVILSLDGRPLVTLTNGQWVTREIAAGPHSLKAYNTLVSKTIDFEVAPGGHAEFMTANVVKGWMFSALSVLGVGPMGLLLERVESA